MKSRTPLTLRSNVVYKFIGLCDADTTYLGMTVWNTITRVKEHLALHVPPKITEVKSHIWNCEKCQGCKFDHFKIMKNCKNEVETKIHEALLIKKHNPKLNKQLLTKGTSYLLRVY